jgi:hypothetical protein
MRVVDEFPYLKQNDKKFNEEMKNIIEVARKTNELEERYKLIDLDIYTVLQPI